ncbi:TPA: DNA mismatch endonuclease Vsr, partial [Legionella pneumophila]|nr:DNA mismatch endonuclease Vsr [Legionella pneumophila]HDO7925610.1 DNA mismatch endonuclease Vsr [Legionella pneumophila]
FKQLKFVNGMDKFPPKIRSEIMKRVKSNNNSPEIAIRKFLFNKGLRYRINDKDIFGTPDLFLKKYNAVIFYNGCFWHNHGCVLSKIPRTNTSYWINKLENNKERDKRNIEQLKKIGFRILIIWRCSHVGKNKTSLDQILNQIYSWILSDSTYKEIQPPFV